MSRTYRTDEYINRTVKLIQHHGPTITEIICMEELAELIQVISKINRGCYSGHEEFFELRKSLIEEIADVLICIDTIQRTEGIDDQELDQEIDRKMKRNMDRIGVEVEGD